MSKSKNLRSTYRHPVFPSYTRRVTIANRVGGVETWVVEMCPVHARRTEDGNCLRSIQASRKTSAHGRQTFLFLFLVQSLTTVWVRDWERKDGGSALTWSDERTVVGD